MKLDNDKVFRFLSTFAITFVFVVFGIWELIQPSYWAGFVPSYASAILDALILVRIHGIVLTLAGLWLIWGAKKRIAAIISAILMIDIIVSVAEGGFSDVLIRDISLLILTIALIFEGRR